tara:strand:- start:242 stop:811 length:570 start_codon:yes stop_codon:yes gene_type:complete
VVPEDINMKKILLIILLLIFSFPSLALSQSKIKLYLDESYTKFIMVEKQDCSIHKNKDNYVSFGFRFGNILFGFGPEVTFGKKNGIEWHRSVQAFISRYQALCNQFNSGSMTKDEYKVETKKLEEIEERMAKIEKEAMEAMDKKADAMFDKMDKELSRLNNKSEFTIDKTTKIRLKLKRIQEELDAEGR